MKALMVSIFRQSVSKYICLFVYFLLLLLLLLLPSPRELGGPQKASDPKPRGAREGKTHRQQTDMEITQ